MILLAGQLQQMTPVARSYLFFHLLKLHFTNHKNKKPDFRRASFFAGGENVSMFELFCLDLSENSEI